MLEKKEPYFLRRNARYHVISNINRTINDIIGYKMNILREHIVNYLWKFCYLNRQHLITFFSLADTLKSPLYFLLLNYVE
jgi:hypothetical protein